MPGHIRSYNKIRENIRENLIEPLEKTGHQCSIYSSVWHNSGFRENNWGGVEDLTLIEQDSERLEVEHHDRHHFVNSYATNKWKNYSHLSGPETCGDAVSMWYKIWKCFNMMEEEFDIVFRLRPDIYFQNKFDPKLLEEVKPGVVCMSEWHGKYEVVTCRTMDHFAFGDFPTMKLYCSVFPNIYDIIKRDDCPHTGEGFLFSTIGHNNLMVKRVPVRYGVMRTYGVENVTP